jgi:GST-like protein
MTLTHPIFSRWPAKHPDRLQLFSLSTPNGVKVGIMLEETSLAYEAHRNDITAGESHDPAFLALNPNGKIPAIYDPDGPSGTPIFSQVGFFNKFAGVSYEDKRPRDRYAAESARLPGVLD